MQTAVGITPLKKTQKAKQDCEGNYSGSRYLRDQAPGWPRPFSVGIPGYQQGVAVTSCTYFTEKILYITPAPKARLLSALQTAPLAKTRASWRACCVSSFDCLAGVQFLGGFGLISVWVWGWFFLKA